MGLPRWLSKKESTYQCRRRRRHGCPPGGEHGNLLQYSCLEHPMDRRVWRARVQRVTKTWARMRDKHTNKRVDRPAEASYYKQGKEKKKIILNQLYVNDEFS